MSESHHEATLRFFIAEQQCKLACSLDECKNLPGHEMLSQKMHDLAQIIAQDRVFELYPLECE
jgi:hypothetical protein